MCAYQDKCVDIHFCCDVNHFPVCAEGSEEKNWENCVGEVRCVVVRVEVYGRDGAVGGMEVYGGRGGAVGGMEVYGGRGGMDVGGGRMRCGSGK